MSMTELMPKLMEWRDEKTYIHKIFNLGMVELQSKNEIICETRPVSWDDSNRVNGTVYAVGAMIDTYPLNLGVFPGDTFNNSTCESFKNSQPISFTPDSRYNAILFSVPAKRILVNIKQGETGRKRHISLFSEEFWKSWQKNYEMAGGSISGFEDSSKPTETQWQALYESAGFDEDTEIPVYFRLYACAPNTQLTNYQRSYGSNYLTFTWTSGGQFSMCYFNSNNNSVRKCCTGVWKKRDGDNSKLDICNVKLTASDDVFTVEGVESMKDNIQAKDTGSSDKDFFPFADNTQLQGCWIAQLTIPIENKPKRQLTRGCGGVTRGSGGATRGIGGVTHGIGGVTRGIGGVTRGSSGKFYFPKMECGEVIREMDDLPDIKYEDHTILKPTLTITSIIVQGDTSNNINKSEEEMKENGINLAKAVLTQYEFVHDMIKKCTEANPEGIQDSAHSIKENKLSNEQQEILDKHAQYKYNAAHFDL
jgi:hypothetical protein